MRKILRSDETDFRYERGRQPMRRVGPWQEQLEKLLASNEGKSLELEFPRFRGRSRGMGRRSIFDAPLERDGGLVAEG